MSVPCFEPNTHRLELTGEDLCRHSLFLGTTGSGKTTVLNAIIQNLISYRAGDPSRRIGMLVFDFKMDETLAKVQQWAREAGRESDVQELSPTSGFYYELISENFTLDHVDELVEKIASVAPLTNPQDSFWWQIRDNLLDAALVILRVTSEKMDFRTATNFIGRWLLNPGMSSDPDGRIRQFEAILRDVRDQLDDKWRNKLDGTKSVIQMWQGLDSRTRGIVAAMLSNCLKPLLGLRAQSYFEPAGRQPLDLRALVEQGKIIVVRVNAAADPPLAQLIGKLIKADFYRLAQERQLTHEDSGRLVGLLMDEYQLAVTGDGCSYTPAMSCALLIPKGLLKFDLCPQHRR